MLIWAILAK